MARLDHAKAFFVTRFRSTRRLSNHTVNLWIGARFDDHRQFAHLLVGQEPGAARTGTVLQAVCPFIVEAVVPSLSSVWRSMPPTLAASARLMPS